MNEIRRSLYQTLTSTPAITGLLAASDGVYHQRIPQDAALPAIVFHKQAGTPVWQMSSAHIQNDLWLVKAVTVGASATVAEDIAAAVDQTLTDATIAITGQHRLAIYRESDVDYPETDGADVYRHCGALYRIVTQPA